MQQTPGLIRSAREERKSVTDTDLVTAGDSTENHKLSASVTTDTSDGPNASGSSPDTNTSAGDGSLSTMVLPELRALANRAGVKGTSGMRKNELIAAIRENRQGHANGVPADGPASEHGGESHNSGTDAPANHAEAARPHSDEHDSPFSRGAEQNHRSQKADQTEQRSRDRNRQDTKSEERESDRNSEKDNPDKDSDKGGDQQGSGGQQNRGGSNQQDDDGDGRGGRRGRRFRERRRRGERPGEGGGDAELREDDVVQPVAGILDVLDNYAFVRTSGYLAGPHDVYVSMNMVRKNGLRRGDAVTGAVRVPKDGEQPNQRQKFNPLVRLDTVNGGPVEDAKKRPDFSKLTPLYPNQRLRLETTPDRLTTRVIDLIMPIGKGQRALIVSPPKAGKTTILQDIANAITQNNPECHLMVVLVDERPEEVTDMTRTGKRERA